MLLNPSNPAPPAIDAGPKSDPAYPPPFEGSGHSSIAGENPS